MAVAAEVARSRLRQGARYGSLSEALPLHPAPVPTNKMKRIQPSAALTTDLATDLTTDLTNRRWVQCTHRTTRHLRTDLRNAPLCPDRPTKRATVSGPTHEVPACSTGWVDDSMTHPLTH